ncbi:TetR/AcrR family transcriptional regulator [Gryllotalpicola protaetiae]|nr:TetR/AcrR family transcriptional regulator [Gryllotalpicola protaetiae]
MLELIQTQGYTGAGLNAVTEHARVPKGSIYFHFPGGKATLGARAVELAAQQLSDQLAEAMANAESPRDVVESMVTALIEMLVESDYRLGCPVSVVTLDASERSEVLRTACAVAFDSWITTLADYLETQRHPRPQAWAMATTIVTSLEGTVILCRAHRSVEALRDTAAVLGSILDHASSQTEALR